VSRYLRRLVLHDRYTLNEEIGEGNLGVLYRGADLQGAVGVLVYILDLGDLESETKWAQLFTESASRLKTMAHPGLARIRHIDTYAEQGLVYAVMERLPGRTLRQILVGRRRLELPTAFRLAAQLAQALQYLHQNSLVHGSLSPETVLVSLDLDRAVLWDVSLVRVRRGSTPYTQMPAPRFGYVAPEQMRQERVDSRADVYLLGCLLYEMLAGRRLFDAGNPETTQVYHRSMAPDRIGPYRRDLHPEAAQWIMSMLSKEPGNRPQDWDQILDTLQRPDLASQPAAVSQPTPATPGMPDVASLEPRTIAPSAAAALAGRPAPETQLAPTIPGVQSQASPRGGARFELTDIQSYRIPASSTQVWIGRNDPRSDPPWQPEIDLSHLPEAHTVSRHHARLLREAQGWRLAPAADANPTVVNHELVGPSGRSLADGDQVQFGLVKMVFREQ